jgi:ribosomal protein L16 Arg81 hydroxylase
MTTIDRIDTPSIETFRAKYLQENRPVVLCGAMDAWPALRQWNLEYLRKVAGSSKLPILNVPGGVEGARFAKGFAGSEMLLRDYLDKLEHTNEKLEHYLAGVSIPEFLQPLAGDIKVPAYIPTESVRQLLWIGRKGTTSPLHYDLMDNFHALVKGRKRFALFDRRETRNLYPRTVLSKTPHLSHVDLNKPDYSRYPRFRRAQLMNAELEAGDMLFLPSCWWHHVTSVEASIAVNFWWKPAHTRSREYLRIQVSGWLRQAWGVRRLVKH